MKNSIKNICIVGLGRQGNVHLEAASALQKMGLLKSIFVFDTDKEKVFSCTKQHSFKIIDNIDYAFHDPTLFVICTPNNLHEKIILNIKHHNSTAIFLKEKPITKGFIGKINDKIVNVAQQRFFNEAYIFAKRHLNLIGELKYFDYQYTLNDNRESWYWDKNSGGGCYINIGWHFIFLAIWFFGNPEKINVTKLITDRKNFSYNTDDTTFVDMYYKNFFGKVYMSVAETNKKDLLRIVGTMGTIEVNKNRCVILSTNGEIIKEKEGDEMIAYMKQIWSICENNKLVLSQLRTLNLKTDKVINTN
jgi:predicted dehydrogenase